MSRSPQQIKGRLLTYKTKSEMLPTFVSGIFLSGAINILTGDTFLVKLSDQISAALMLLSSLLFFVLASKIHELQTWYNAQPETIKRDSEKFITDPDAWNLGKKENCFYKKYIHIFSPLGWVLGVASVFIYLFGAVIVTIITDICQKIFLR